MSFRRQRRRSTVIDVTSLIDVVFILIIFLMVSTTFEKPGKLELKLPSAQSATRSPSSSQLMELRIDAQGQWFLDGIAQPIPDQAALEKALRHLANQRAGDFPVTIAADAETPHRAVIAALDAARLAGLSQIRFAATIKGHAE